MTNIWYAHGTWHMAHDYLILLVSFAPRNIVLNVYIQEILYSSQAQRLHIHVREKIGLPHFSCPAVHSARHSCRVKTTGSCRSSVIVYMMYTCTWSAKLSEQLISNQNSHRLWIFPNPGNNREIYTIAMCYNVHCVSLAGRFCRCVKTNPRISFINSLATTEYDLANSHDDELGLMFAQSWEPFSDNWGRGIAM